MSPKKALLGIQYVGVSGITARCIDAVLRILQNGERITHARILSSGGHHCLLLTLELNDLVAVKCGFSSGYPGEGPRGLSSVLQILDAFNVEVDETEVSQDVLSRIDRSCLTQADLTSIEEAGFVRPTRWHEYMVGRDWDAPYTGLREFNIVMPWAIVDSRIVDLALEFDAHPDETLFKGFRRLEDIVRERTGLKLHGAKLFSETFLSSKPKLKWKRIESSEQVARGNLFVGAFGAFRNPRAHKERKHTRSEQLCEFLVLNQLFRMEAEAQGGKRRRIQPEQ